MKKSFQYRFTLIEIMAVIAIMVLLGTLIVGRMKQSPAKVLLDNCVSQIEKFYSYCAFRAISEGKIIEIGFYEEDKVLVILTPPQYTKGALLSSAAEKNLENSYQRLRFADNIELDFEVDETVKEEAKTQKQPYKVASYYPDGIGYGPLMNIVVNAQNVKIQISPLSGFLLKNEEFQEVAIEEDTDDES